MIFLKKITKLTSIILVGVAIGVFVSGKASAYCEADNGTPSLTVNCTKDADCFPPTPGTTKPDGTPRCAMGTVCDTVNVDPPACVSPLGYSGISNNKIAGGYELTGSGTRGLGLLINNIVLAVGAVSGLIFFTMLILGGITYMSSQGDEKMVAKAKNQITAGLVGIIIVFMSWWAVKIISVIFGINLLTPSFTGP